MPATGTLRYENLIFFEKEGKQCQVHTKDNLCCGRGLNGLVSNLENSFWKIILGVDVMLKIPIVLSAAVKSHLNFRVFLYSFSPH